MALTDPVMFLALAMIVIILAIGALPDAMEIVRSRRRRRAKEARKSEL
jgi:type II secretory pathway pseudopilin PulG